LSTLFRADGRRFGVERSRMGGDTARASAALLCVALASASGAVDAQLSGGTFELSASVIANGGEVAATAGDFRLGGSVAQTDVAASAPLRGGDLALTGGFWQPAASAPIDAALFSDGFE
jgi:hypothetical protein